MKDNTIINKLSNHFEIVSMVYSILHIPFVLYHIHKRGSVTKLEAISLLLDGIVAGYAIYKLDTYLEMKVNELKTELEMEEE